MLPTREAKRNQKPPNSKESRRDAALQPRLKALPCQMFLMILNKVLTLLLRHIRSSALRTFRCR